MSFNPTAYNTRQYEVASIGDSPTVIQPGTALKCSGIPTGIFSPDFYYKVGVCAPTDNVFGVVSSQGSAITDKTTSGRIVLMNAGLIPVLTEASGKKLDYLKVSAKDGKWVKCAMGETSEVQLVEDSTAGNLAWAKPIRVTVA